MLFSFAAVHFIPCLLHIISRESAWTFSLQVLQVRRTLANRCIDNWQLSRGAGVLRSLAFVLIFHFCCKYFVSICWKHISCVIYFKYQESSNIFARGVVFTASTQSEDYIILDDLTVCMATMILATFCYSFWLEPTNMYMLCVTVCVMSISILAFTFYNCRLNCWKHWVA